MTDIATPRTDALVNKHSLNDVIELCRSMERELLSEHYRLIRACSELIDRDRTVSELCDLLLSARDDLDDSCWHLRERINDTIIKIARGEWE